MGGINTRSLSPTTAMQFFQIARYGALVLTSILLTKSSLTQDDIGHYETFILMSGTLSFFWVNGILQNFLSQFHKTEDKKSLITNTAIILLGFSLLMIIILVFVKQPILNLFKFDISGNLFILFLLYFLFNNLTFLTDYLFLAKENSKALIYLGTYHLLFQTALLALPAFFYGSYDMVINGLIIFIAIKFLITLILLFKNGSFQIDTKLMRSFLILASPLMLTFFLGGMAIYADGIIVNNFYDKATFAMFQYGAREFPLSLLLANAFSAAMALQVSKDTQNMEMVRSGSLKLIKQLFPVCIILLIVSQWLYPIIFNPNFKESYVYFNIYLLLLIPRMVFPHSILLGLGKTKEILRASLIEFILNISISLSLMHFIGLQGIAYGTVIAFVVNKLILAQSLNKYGVRLKQYIPITQLSVYSIILVTVFIVFTYIIK